MTRAGEPQEDGEATAADAAAAQLASLSLSAAASKKGQQPPPPPPLLQGVAGVDAAARALRELVLWPRLYAKQGAALGVRWPRGLLLHGPPGCGKTSLVRAAAAEAGASLHVVTAGAVFGAYLGESERRLRDAFAAAARDAAAGKPALVFLDEVDALCPRRAAGGGGGGGSGQHEARVVAQLLTLLDGAAGLEEGCAMMAQGQDGTTSPFAARVAVVAATNRPNAVDPALRRPGRLDREVLIPVPDAAARAQILRLHAKGMRLASGVDLAAVARACHGYSGADLAALCREAAMCALSDAAAAAAVAADMAGQNRHQPKQQPRVVAGVTAAHFSRAARRVGPSVVRGAAVDPGPVRWSDVGGLEAAKTALRRAVEWPLTRGADFARLGVEPPRGVLLYGPPGCSKTTLARAAAAESGATFVPLSCASLYSPYVGEGEAALRDAFARARAAAPAVLLLDEADALAPGRGEGGSGGGSGGEEDGGAALRLLSTLLTEMDGLGAATSAYSGSDGADARPAAAPAPGVVVAAATNRPGALDAALLRPGRLDVHVFVGPPADAEERLAALQVHCRELPLAADVDLKQVAERTGRFTGAELAALCREAAMGALRERFSSAAAAAEEGGEGEEEDGGAAVALGVEVGMRHFEAARRAMAPALTEAELRRYADWGRRADGGR
jgi:SpoVK/Ycf46/Vps4 family AAA+-type ATPase